MSEFGNSKPWEKAGDNVDKENQESCKKRRGVLIAFVLILLCFLIWGVLGKPKWLKIEVSNCFVALLSVGFTYFFLRLLHVRSRVVKFVLGFLWLLFLPNTAYLFTDLGHFIYQWNDTGSLASRLLLILQYFLMELFGVITFLISFFPFEKIINQVNAFKKRKVPWLISFNFLVAYGMVLGRFEHINSWILIANPLKVLGSAINIFVAINLLIY